MSGIVPGLHPHTRAQRKGSDGAWALTGENAFEARDVPPRWVAAGIAGLIATLLVSVAAVLWFADAARPRGSLHAATAQARFHTTAPPLETDPPAERAALERAHPAPRGPALDAAFDAVLRHGWGDPAPPPGRAATALERAKAGQ